MSIKIITFDIDGTLMRRYPSAVTLKVEAIDYAVRKVFGLDNFNYLDHLQPHMFGMTDRSIMRLLLKQLGCKSDHVESSVDTMLDESLAYFNSHPEHTVVEDYYLLPGAEQLLVELHKLGITMGLATGNYERFARWKVDGLGIGDYFTFGGFGEDAEDRADVIAAALKRINLNGKSACHFGDTPVDIQAAHKNNILAGAITSNGGATFGNRELCDAGADLIVDSWNELDKILKFINSN